jgi:predicted DNA-binding protein (MmcQ/YjbR family)
MDLVAPRRKLRSLTSDEVFAYCAGRVGADETYPFREGLPVFKVGGRVFAIVSFEGQHGYVTLKCDPELAIELRTRFAAVQPGYHTNKRHWNTVDLDGTVDADELREMIDHSYELVVASLTKAQRARITSLDD